MLFYASLFVVSLIAACILIWMFRSLKEVGTAVYRVFLPSHKGNVKAERLAHLSDHLQSTATPWGWDSSESRVRAEPHRRVDPDAPVPWGWRGNQNNATISSSKRSGKGYLDKANLSGVFDKVRNTVGISDSSEEDVKVGWPYREESFDFAGSKYKYSSKPKTRKTGSSKNSKPWGW